MSAAARAPDESCLSWQTYLYLLPDDDPAKNDVNLIPPSIRDTAKRPLTQEDINAYQFESPQAACLAFLRAQALLDTDRKRASIETSKAYLLMAKAALWLARHAHYQNIDKKPSGTDEIKEKTKNASLAKFVQTCILVASEQPIARATALSQVAAGLVHQVANDTGPQARPGMAEGFLIKAEWHVFMAELVAAQHANQATKVVPEKRRGPWGLEPTEEDELPDDYDEHLNWSINIPSYNGGAGDAKTYLADYWWGQDKTTAISILSSYLCETFKLISRYQMLSDEEIRKRFWSREILLESDLQRRGAASLMGLDRLSNTPKERDMINKFRILFPGTWFEPTEDFVKGLRQRSDDSPHMWSMTCLLGLNGMKNRTLVTVMDTDPDSRWDEMIVGGKLFDGDVVDEYYRPTPRELYKVLLCAISGAGDESRCHTGPPRKPNFVNVSYRLLYAGEGLKELLSRIGVECEVDSEESLRFACISNGTDFETGGHPSMQQTLVGQRVGLYDLLKRDDLNGRVGRVIRWHEDQKRWEVKLECLAPGETSLKIGVRPANLSSCPDHFENTQDYLGYRSMLRSESKTRRELHGAGPALEKLRGADLAPEDSICAICQQPTSVVVEDHSCPYLGLGNSTSLPCKHAFHLSCILPWLTGQKSECPCCRLKF